MCGIAGFRDLSCRTNAEELRASAARMAESLRHRGPDDGDVWVEAEAGIALGHRRLAVVDLSPMGHQPMHSACGRYVIAFNGEVYNFKALRRDLEACDGSIRFRGHSDTEVMLAAISRWGLEEALQRFNGMFAFALWDRQERELYLVRDRLGEKPLYYGRIGSNFLFGSELKSLRAHPGFKAEIDRDALALFLRHNYIPAPYSIYRGVQKLPPAAMLTLTEELTDPVPVPYWSARRAAEDGIHAPFAGPVEEALECLDALLREAVGMRMEADVPLGAFLSGGIDSSTVVALMQAQSTRPVKTFTIGFREAGFDEAAHAREVARHLGTDHTELYVTPEEAMQVVPRLPTLYDEPFADASQIPTFLVSNLARRHVTVSLSGDGGDELFGGYDRYTQFDAVWRKVRRMPGGVRAAASHLLAGVSSETERSLLGSIDRILPTRIRRWNPNGKSSRLAALLGAKSLETMYRGLVSHMGDPACLVAGAHEPATAHTDRERWAQVETFIERMMYLDTVAYLPDDVLAKVDRASMGVSLEARVPLLDHRVVEFAWRLPLALKVRDGQGKWLLRQLLYRYVPKALIERPKMGFGVPIGDWLTCDLRDWAHALLDPRRLAEQGFLDPKLVRVRWEQHQRGERDWEGFLWNVLMFQAWISEQ